LDWQRSPPPSSDCSLLPRFWLAYFDFFSIRGERILGELQGADQVAFARDAYV
jgi:hypothetical protein